MSEPAAVKPRMKSVLELRAESFAIDDLWRRMDRLASARKGGACPNSELSEWIRKWVSRLPSGMSIEIGSDDWLILRLNARKDGLWEFLP